MVDLLSSRAEVRDIYDGFNGRVADGPRSPRHGPAASARLPVEQRTALVMVTVQGMSYEEVAAAMNCAVGTAKCRVFRARQTLQRWLTGEERGSNNRTATNRAVAQPRRGASGKSRAFLAVDEGDRATIFG